MKKRASRSALSLTLALIFAVIISPAARASVPDRPENKYVLDSAEVLSGSTERRIIAENQELFEEYGAEIVVAAVDFLGGEDIEDYAYEMFNSWGVGSQERNNGILLVLAVGEEDYYCQAGYGIDDYFSGWLLDRMLSEHLEPDFAKEDYDMGVLKIFDALSADMRTYYKSGMGSDESLPPQNYDDYEYYDDGGEGEYRRIKPKTYRGSLKELALTLVKSIVGVAIILFVFRLLRGPRGGNGPGGGGGGGRFWRGMLLGSMMNQGRRPYWGTPPPPPPPPPGGFGPRPGRYGPRHGGSGGFGSSGGFGGSGGFHSGGRSHGGGAGRGFGGGGGGFHGGGGSHGGGAGRHK